MVQDRPENIHIEIQHRDEMESALNAAVDALSQNARSAQQGILVTRRGPATFSASLEPGIPYGAIHERVEW